MERKILFRGKRINRNGEWGYGDLRRYNGNTWVFPHDQEAAYDADMVDPNTIGQFTGFVDKNGNRIFEGDIISNPKRTLLHQIIWDESWAKFKAISGDVYNSSICQEWIDEYEKEIIGNIYDNPELLCTN